MEFNDKGIWDDEEETSAEDAPYEETSDESRGEEIKEQPEEKSKAQKAADIIFKLSFAPALIILLVSVVSISKGVTFFRSRSYGAEGFFLNLLCLGIDFSLIYPVLPACLCYQVAYRIITDNKEIMDKGRIASIIVICVILVGMITAYFHLAVL